MKIKIKKGLAAVLIGVLAAIPLHSAETYKMRNINAAAATTNFSTSYYSAANITIQTENNAFVFTDLPDDSKFSKVRVSLYKINAGATTGETINRQDLSGKTPVRYDLSNIENGTYYIQLYYLTGKTYKSYWFQKGGPVLVKTSDGVSISQSNPYERNVATFQTRASGKDALDYYLKPDLMIDCDNPDVIAKAKEVTKGITDDYQKVLAVHDWIANNIWYDMEYLERRSTSTERVSSDVLKSQKAVCQGYANLAAGMLRALGIPSKTTNGYALSLGTTDSWTNSILDGDVVNHAWNEAYVNGRWIIFDCTWDSNNVYTYYPEQRDASGKIVKTKVSNPRSQGTGLTGYQNFDPTLDAFSATHYIMDQETSLFTALKKIYKTKSSTVIEGDDTISIWDTEPDPGDVSVQYIIENSEIASINDAGVIKGLKEGQTIVTTIVSLGKNTTAYETTVTIRNPVSAVETTPPDEEDRKEDNSDISEEERIDPTATPENTFVPEKPDETPDPEVTEINPSEEETADMETLLNNVEPSLKAVELYYGGNINNKAKVLYYGVTETIRDKIRLAYSMSNPKVATIANDGTITSKGAGTTTLTIRYEVDGYIKSDSISITVKKATISLKPAVTKLKKGKTVSFKTTLTGVSGTVKWKTSNSKIATVSKSGKVKGKKKGTVTITAYIGNVKNSKKIKIY